MIFLILSIIAVIVLVGIAIRRLPYLRTHRPGLEITIPRPYIGSLNAWQTLWLRVKGWGIQSFDRISNLVSRRPGMKTTSTHQPLTPVETGSFSGSTAHPDGTVETVDDETFIAGKQDENHPFWSEEPSADATDLPVKGLVTRRGEAQKIAFELTTQADAAFRKKDYKTAEKFYLQAATKDPDNARIYNRLGVIYLQTKNYKDAVEAFRGSIKFDDRVASRHYNLALAYLGKKDYRSAQKAVEEAIRLEPTNDKYRQTHEALSQ